ncbi:hypothetical protein [Wolbachia endosymbiont of Folsomia candida]|uniref:hypothetical protein n=1 Tax=Wolbachia endosymbiont of Folsomia candida TaxID=169402 RepID=UPI000B26B95C|nr:hypothetical protein [Wolbachia endosymbiont of Folsomia candida]APR98380.1 hypothetical protein ASM33_03770 [Wolbachia endosymbiont of Folsomia candida]
MSNDRLNVYNNYIQKHSLSGFKSGLKYGTYLYIGATFACLMSPLCFILGANVLANILILPLAILISNPIAWIVMGMIFIAASGVIMSMATPLFHLAKDLINKARVQKKSEEKDIEHEPTLETPERSITPIALDIPKTPDRESGIVIQEVVKDSFVTATNKGNYEYELTTTDIRGIAESKYGWTAHKDRKGLKNISKGVFFACPDDLTCSLEKELKEYKNKVKQGSDNLIFTSILNLNGNHWVTLVVSYDKESKKFRAYYCDSFGKPIPNDISDVLNNTLGIDSSDIGISEAEQQKDGDTWNCGIFALINAKKITDMIKEGKSFGEIGNALSRCKFSLERKRKVFADALKQDKQSRSSTPDDRSRRISGDSLDSGCGLDGEEFCGDWPTLVHQTNRGNYGYWLQQHDISYIARIQYGYLEASENNVFFSITGDVNSLNERLKEYKNKAEQENSKKTFTSVINLGGNHWVTLVVSYNPANKKFVAYYCDSFGTPLPDVIDPSVESSIYTANKITEKQLIPLMNENSKLIRKQESNTDNSKIEEEKQNNEAALRCVRQDKEELVNKQINTAHIVGILQATLGINDNSNIKSSKAKQQNDGWNCGIFALENANIITQMLTEGKSLDDVEKELSEYKLDLDEKRREFTRALMNDEEWRSADENDLLYDRAAPFSKTESVLSLQSVLSYCPIV